jgi:hypothetical protein
MLTTLTLASILAFVPVDGPVVCVEPGRTAVAENFRELYESGVGYDDFLENAGQETVAELVSILESANAGVAVCGR